MAAGQIQIDALSVQAESGGPEACASASATASSEADHPSHGNAFAPCFTAPLSAVKTIAGLVAVENPPKAKPGALRSALWEKLSSLELPFAAVEQLAMCTAKESACRRKAVALYCQELANLLVATTEDFAAGLLGEGALAVHEAQLLCEHSLGVCTVQHQETLARCTVVGCVVSALECMRRQEIERGALVQEDHVHRVFVLATEQLFPQLSVRHIH